MYRPVTASSFYRPSPMGQRSLAMIAMPRGTAHSCSGVGTRIGPMLPRRPTQMKIESLTLREIHMPLVHFFETSFGRTYNRRVMLVTVHCQGLDGWAECVAGEDPFYSEETVETAWWVITNYLAPAIIGRAFTAGRECVPFFARVREHRMAKAAVENALWDVEAREKKQPLWKLLGGTRRQIACGVSIGIQDTVEQLLEK